MSFGSKHEREPVLCDLEEEMMEAEGGQEILGVVLTCSVCGHVTKSFGTNERSIKRCLWLMRQECPADEKNFYEVGSSSVV